MYCVNICLVLISYTERFEAIDIVEWVVLFNEIFVYILKLEFKIKFRDKFWRHNLLLRLQTVLRFLHFFSYPTNSSQKRFISKFTDI